MKLPRFPLAVTFSTATCLGQLPEACEVKRVNEPYYYVTALTHPITGRAYNVPGYQPPGYWSATPTDPGVPAGYRTWRWVPSAVNMRRETRHVSGFCVYLRPSAPTVQFPFTGYIPQWQLLPTRQRGATSADGYEPDTTLPAHTTVPQASLAFPQPGAARVRSVLSQAVPLTAEEVAFALRWQGGEHRLKPASQGLVGTTDEAPWSVPTWGQIDPSGTVSVTDPAVTIGAYTTLWLTHYETQPSIVAESDFAHLRRVGSPLPFSGFNDAAGLCDLGTNSLDVGWNVVAGASRGNAWVVPFFNAGTQVFPGSSLLLGETIELDVADPLFGVLADAGYVGQADPTGFFDGPRLAFSALGAPAVGLFVGVEYLVIDSGLSTVLGSTQAHWLEVIR